MGAVAVSRDDITRRQIQRDGTHGQPSQPGILGSNCLAFFRHTLTFYRKTPASSTSMLPTLKRAPHTIRHQPRPANVERFAINANNVTRARRFYADVFQWKFEPWGPPDFFVITTGSAEEPGIRGALHKRREVILDKPIYGFECSISVDDINVTISAIKAHGGKIVVPKTRIPGVGTLVMFEDTEGNIVTAIQYETFP